MFGSQTCEDAGYDNVVLVASIGPFSLGIICSRLHYVW